MKTISSISLLSLLSAALPTWALAVPQSTTPNNVLRTRAILERAPAPEDCGPNLDTVISAVDASGVSGTAVGVYALGSGFATFNACQLVVSNGQVLRGNCANVAGLVASGVGVIYYAIQNSGTGTKPTRRDDSGFANLLAEHFEADGIPYQSITSLSVSKRDVDAGNGTVGSARVMQDRLSLKGVQHADGFMDAIVTTFSDGTGHVFVNPTPVNATTLSKRHDGPGFKINYRRIKYASSFLGTPDLKGVNNDLANAIASNWATRADDDGINEFILTTGITSPKLETIGIRIIGETAGYGEEYESVDICGTLGSSHDELKV